MEKKRINTAIWYEQYKRWQIKVQRDGERKTFSSCTPGRKGQIECNAKADAWLERGIVDASMRLRKLYDRFIQDLKDNGNGQSAWRPLESFGNNWIKPYAGKYKMGDLTEQHLQIVLNAAAQKGLSKKTLKDIRGAITKFLKYARKCGTTTLRPEDLEISSKAPISNRRSMQPDDIKILFTATKTTYNGKIVDDWYIYAYRFSVLCGLRPGELVGIRNTDIKDNSVTIKRAYNIYDEETDGKNKNATRTICLPELAIHAITQQRKMLRRANIISHYLFPRQDGSRTSQEYIKGYWDRYREYNGISKITPYELRHTFASVAKDVSGEKLKAVMGHSETMDSKGVYSHELEGEAQETANIINALFERLIK